MFMASISFNTSIVEKEASSTMSVQLFIANPGLSGPASEDLDLPKLKSHICKVKVVRKTHVSSYMELHATT